MHLVEESEADDWERLQAFYKFADAFVESEHFESEHFRLISSMFSSISSENVRAALLKHISRRASDSPDVIVGEGGRKRFSR